MAPCDLPGNCRGIRRVRRSRCVRVPRTDAPGDGFADVVPPGCGGGEAGGPRRRRWRAGAGGGLTCGLRGEGPGGTGHLPHRPPDTEPARIRDARSPGLRRTGGGRVLGAAGRFGPRQLGAIRPGSIWREPDRPAPGGRPQGCFRQSARPVRRRAGPGLGRRARGPSDARGHRAVRVLEQRDAGNVRATGPGARATGATANPGERHGLHTARRTHRVQMARLRRRAGDGCRARAHPTDRTGINSAAG